jgi:uncharacterized protein
MRRNRQLVSSLVASTAILLAADAQAQGSDNSGQAARASSFGVYSGFSPVIYDGWELQSIYVPVRDGTRIAIDLIRPKQGSQVVEARLPVIWMHSPYNRRPRGGKSQAETYPGGPLELVKHGYVVAVADFRGLYASFGRNRLYNFGEMIEPAWYDAYDVTEWLAAQPWSSGKVGMWGCSATGYSQLQAASTAPPSLKAIFPLSPGFDTYEFLNYGGSPSSSQATAPATARERGASASPVDGPDGEDLLAQAIAGQADDLGSQTGMPFRNSLNPALGGDWWTRSSVFPYLSAIHRSGVAIYAGGNWDETGTKIAPAQVFANSSPGRRKLVLAPHGHCQWNEVAAETGFHVQIEQLRFFDYWLKGIDNGIMREPAVTYFTYNAPKGTQWRQSDTWPLAEERRTLLYLGDGVLTHDKVRRPMQRSINFGPPSIARSTTLVQAPGGAVFETSPLPADLELTGYPLVKAWIESHGARDADIVARLSDVSPGGTERSYAMSGRLRASQRKTGAAPYDTLGAPYHTHRSEDVQLLERGMPVRLEIGMMPMSYIFPKGHRIRLTISASAPGGETGDLGLLLGGNQATLIELPVIPDGARHVAR